MADLLIITRSALPSGENSTSSPDEVAAYAHSKFRRPEHRFYAQFPAIIPLKTYRQSAGVQELYFILPIEPLIV